MAENRKISLLEQIKLAATLHLTFVGMSVVKAADNTYVATLQLADPIEELRSSQELEFKGERHPIFARGITEVKVHQDDMANIVWDRETNEGEYHGDDLVLDVDKKKVTWLRGQSFAQSAQSYRREMNDKRIAELVEGAEPTTTGKTALTPVDNG